MIDRTNARAIMDRRSAAPIPKLAYLRGQNPIKATAIASSPRAMAASSRGACRSGWRSSGLDGEQWRVQAGLGLRADRLRPGAEVPGSLRRAGEPQGTQPAQTAIGPGQPAVAGQHAPWPEDRPTARAINPRRPRRPTRPRPSPARPTRPSLKAPTTVNGFARNTRHEHTEDHPHHQLTRHAARPMRRPPAPKTTTHRGRPRHQRPRSRRQCAGQGHQRAGQGDERAGQGDQYAGRAPGHQRSQVQPMTGGSGFQSQRTARRLGLAAVSDPAVPARHRRPGHRLSAVHLQPARSGLAADPGLRLGGGAAGDPAADPFVRHGRLRRPVDRRAAGPVAGGAAWRPMAASF